MRVSIRPPKNVEKHNNWYFIGGTSVRRSTTATTMVIIPVRIIPLAAYELAGYQMRSSDSVFGTRNPYQGLGFTQLYSIGSADRMRNMPPPMIHIVRYAGLLRN
jgi:hypothetical protein